MKKIPGIKVGKVGKGNSLFYALMITGFLFFNTIHLEYTKTEGWSFKSKEPPLEISTACLVLIAVALGVNLSGILQSIAHIAAVVTRNSAAINSIAAQTGAELPSEKETDLPETEDKL